MYKTAVIMAAGFGSRFGQYTENIPKGFIKFGGIPMIERSIQALINCGITRIIIGTGYHKEKFEELASCYPCIECVFSPRYAETNSMYTLYNCREVVGDDDAAVRLGEAGTVGRGERDAEQAGDAREPDEQPVASAHESAHPPLREEGQQREADAADHESAETKREEERRGEAAARLADESLAHSLAHRKPCDVSLRTSAPALPCCARGPSMACPRRARCRPCR